LGLQCLILRDNGYTCREGLIYYRTTKQRVRMAVTTELESWIISQIAAAHRASQEPIPPPLPGSPKCPRCSLVSICLPDETRLLAGEKWASSLPVNVASVPKVEAADEGAVPQVLPESSGQHAGSTPRRLIAPRQDERALYLNTPGLRVGRKDEVLQIKEEGKVLDEVRINDIAHVALFGNIQISTQAIQTLCDHEVPITFFSMGGWFYGITRGHELKNVFLRIEQFRLARDAPACLALARQFVQGKIRNHRTLMMRNHLEPPPSTLLRLKRFSEMALTAKSIEELLGIEGAAANEYFQQFNGLIKVQDELATSAVQPT